MNSRLNSSHISSYNPMVNTSSVHPSLMCKQHDNEFITNMCVSQQCFEPLCPDCIFPHTEHHRNQNSHASIKSLRSVKQECLRKLQDIQGSLGDVSCQDYSAIVQLEKNKVMALVERKFQELDQRLQYEQQQNKMASIQATMQELQNWQESLEGNAYQDTIKNVAFHLNQWQLKLLDENSFKKEFQEKVLREDITLVCQQDRFNVLQAELDKYIYLDRPQNNSRFPKETSQLFVPPRDSIKSDFGQQNIKISQSFQRLSHDDNKFSENSKKRSSLANQLPQKIVPDTPKPNFIKINLPDYFKGEEQLLHFFPNGQKSFFYYNMRSQSNFFQQKVKFIQQNLNIDFDIPLFHKSIITPQGQIFMMGGSDQQTGLKSNKNLLLDRNQWTFISKAPMFQGRSSFALVHHQDYIYIVGGFIQGQAFTNTCERYSVKNDQWHRIASLNFNAVSACLCSFNQNLYKFGGLLNGESINHHIEMYNPLQNIWSVLNVHLAHQLKPTLFSTSCSIQINEKQIMIFGGYDQNNDATPITYLLDTDTLQVQADSHNVLPFAEGFWNNTPIVQRGMIFALQNIPNNSNDDCLEDLRRILVFDQEWSTLN